MVEISYEGQVLWLVGVYASNVSQERKLLWRSLTLVLDNGRPGLFMGDLIVCSIVLAILPICVILIHEYLYHTHT